ncbi:hypothetical protein EDD18DRAFT_1101725 [Armillaria luteobubalina]|uniref:DUF1793-domain-containing protein n=1 Tax=Armillaria luteobubalina TaxID=153913 RepID=A0AA39QFN4_9AGAR|nr:hypothetical protein EDD18DRAFT_1101725 [Armillaria luteobubalina]
MAPVLDDKQESNDGQEHSIQLYSDITAEWVSGDPESLAEWSTTKTESSTIHKAARQSLSSMQEIGSLAEDTTVYYAFPLSNDTTYQTGDSGVVRSEFQTNGSSVVWAIGLVRDPVISLSSTSGNNNRSSYFWTAYNTVSDAIDFFLGDFSNPKQRAIGLDNKIVSDARQISDNYADLVTLAARQALAVDITVSKDRQGQWNTSDVMSFMRDMGNSRRVNPVDIIYASFPAYLYFNATWAGYFLEPLLRYQQSLQYTKIYAAPDLGSSYPNAAGNTNPSIFGAIEDTGNMLIMGWAHARFSGDGSSISRYYDLYKKWADYLVSVTLCPNGYTDADGLSNTNMTNLAIKGIIAIKAMSEISQALGRSQDSEIYSSTAKSYVEQWQIAAGSTGHLLSTYGSAADSSSWSLVYNLFADKLLGTELVDSSVSTRENATFTQDTWYSHEADTYWTMFAAGASNDTTPWPRGHVFITGSTSPKPDRLRWGQFIYPSNAGAIAGGVTGGFAVLILLFYGVLRHRRHQRRKQEDTNDQPSTRTGASSNSRTCLILALGIDRVKDNQVRILDQQQQHLCHPINHQVWSGTGYLPQIVMVRSNFGVRWRTYGERSTRFGREGFMSLRQNTHNLLYLSICSSATPLCCGIDDKCPTLAPARLPFLANVWPSCQSYAFSHSICNDHHVFIKLETAEMGIRSPTPPWTTSLMSFTRQFTKSSLPPTPSQPPPTKPAYDLASNAYVPGYVGLNIKHNDHMNVIIHALLHISPLRDALLLSPSNSKSGTELTRRFSALAKEHWNPRHGSKPRSSHEFLQEMNRASGGKFRLEQQGDPVGFLLLNRLHKDLGGTKKKNSSIIFSTFQAQLRVDTWFLETETQSHASISTGK